MKIGLISTAVPLVFGGGRFIVDWLYEKLIEEGHQVEIVYIPSTSEANHILSQMVACRLMKLDEYFERIITIRPPAHMVQHPRKVVWFIHHLREYYDLWDTRYCPILPDTAGFQLRDAVIEADNQALKEAHRLYTNSRVVGDRVRKFNGLQSEVLYPPILRPEMFHSSGYGDEIVSVCRMEHHKRQHLLVEAMAHTKTQVRLRLCGTSLSAAYIEQLRDAAAKSNAANRITIDARWITEEEKADVLATALASAYVPVDEDSYGYPTIEAAHARKCTVTVNDSGGVPEFVTHGITGLIADPTPAAVGQAFDQLFSDRALAGTLGEAAHRRIDELGINWKTVIGKLLA